MSEYIVDFYSMSMLSRVIESNDTILRYKIVRCKDCKHFTPQGTHKFENGKTNADFCEYVRGWRLQITPDGFCAWAERREA